MNISSHTDVYEPSEDDYRLFIQNSMTYVFVSFRPPYLCPSEGHKHGVSIHSLINLSKTFLRISPARNIAQTWIFATQFEYSSSFSSLIFDFICWMVLLLVWQWKPAIRPSLMYRVTIPLAVERLTPITCLPLTGNPLPHPQKHGLFALCVP